MSVVVAITGGSGSGKTTLAEALLAALGEPKAVIFREDAYYWPRAHFAGRDPRLVDYDHPSAKDTAHLARDLAALKAGSPVDQPIYDFERHDRAEACRRIDPRSVVLLEGIHVLSVPELRPLIDLAVYVDTPDDLRLARRIRRDVVQRGRDVEGVLAQYLLTVRSAHHRHTHPAKFVADLVLADEGVPAWGEVTPSPEALARLVAPVLDRLVRLGVH